jgi:hypothetical protein
MPKNQSLLESVVKAEASVGAPGVIRFVLQAVCVADILLVGLLILFAPQFLFRLFDVKLPEDMLWFQMIGLMLIPLAIDGLIGFRSSEQYRSNVVVSGVTRLATAGFLLVVASVRSVPWILIVLAIGEGLVGCLTLYYLRGIVRLLRKAETKADGRGSAG